MLEGRGGARWRLGSEVDAGGGGEVEAGGGGVRRKEGGHPQDRHLSSDQTGAFQRSLQRLHTSITRVL